MPDYATSYHQLITIEAPGFNNTFQPPLNCPNANNAVFAFGSQQANKWAAIYLAPIVKRLQGMITGFTVMPEDVFAMQSVCAYEVR